MSDINRMLAQHFNQIKEHFEIVINNVKSDYYDAAMEAALNEAETIKKNQTYNWKEYWEAEVVGIKDNDYCRLKAKVKGILESLQFRIDSLALSITLGGSSTQQDTHDKMVRLEIKIKAVAKYLEILCTLKTFHKSFCEAAEAHGG